MHEIQWFEESLQVKQLRLQFLQMQLSSKSMNWLSSLQLSKHDLLQESPTKGSGHFKRQLFFSKCKKKGTSQLVQLLEVLKQDLQFVSHCLQTRLSNSSPNSIISHLSKQFLVLVSPYKILQFFHIHKCPFDFRDFATPFVLFIWQFEGLKMILIK